MTQLNPNHIKRYNLIPKKLLIGKVFEVGAGTGQYQLASKHKEAFLSEDYIGIDSMSPIYDKDKMEKDINIIKADIFKMSIFGGKYDTVIAIEVMEHIVITKWKELVQKMKDLLKIGGYLYITVPYKEKARFYKGYTPHLVFGISEAIIKELLPEAELKISSHYGLWRGTEEDLTKMTLKTFLRGFRRLLFHRTYCSFLSYNLIIKWKKEEHEEEIMSLRKHFENNYHKNLGSGFGSVGKLRTYKHKILKKYLKNYKKFSFLDLGCGDLSFWYSKPPENYIGIDFARNIQKTNREKFQRTFVTQNISDSIGYSAEVVICFDVLFHIIEEEEFLQIIQNIVKTSEKWIFIYNWIKDPIDYEKNTQQYRNLENYKHYFEDFKLLTVWFPDFAIHAGLYVFEKRS